MIGIIGAVGDEAADRSRAVEQVGGNGDVVDVSRRQDEDPRPAFAIRERMELARATAA
jgi:hypothetical protein